MEEGRTVVIIGAGPAGLTAALELIRLGGFRPLVFDLNVEMGGISRTEVRAGNRIDIGGHRFFSKSKWVNDWWRQILPLAGDPGADGDAVMLERPRVSRIYHGGNFFDYPLSLNATVMRRIGLRQLALVGSSYVRAKALPRYPERSLEDFMINRFGRRLYEMFFRDYTEKVWGIPCDRISPDWGAQRIKGLSVAAALADAVGRMLPARFRQREVKTSLIERFIYPRLGPGQLWTRVAQQVEAGGGRIFRRHQVTAIERDGERVVAVRVRDLDGGEERRVEGEHFISTMPVCELMAALRPAPPAEVMAVAAGLPYRDFMTVGLLFDRLKPHRQSPTPHANNLLPDTWIYVQDPAVKLGRLQVFNNWSPDMVASPGKVWLGLEYFCAEGDGLWSGSDADLIDFGARELATIGLADPADLRYGAVLRQPKAYPAYFGTYGEFPRLRAFADHFANLFLVGRNGMHRYNNMDHSMMTAKLAVDAIAAGSRDRAAIWNINIDDNYSE